MKIIFLKPNPFNIPVGRIENCSESVAKSFLDQELALEYKKENMIKIQKELDGSSNNSSK